MAGAAAAVSDEMAQEVAAMGTAQDCQSKMDEFEKAGASYVLLYPVPIDGTMTGASARCLQAFGS